MNARLPELMQFNAEWEAMRLDQDLDRRRTRRDELIAWKEQLCREDEEPLVDDLRAAGFEGNSVWDLVNQRGPYPEFMDVLREHAARDYLSPIREGIFRALMEKDDQGQSFTVLKREWIAGTDKNEKSTRWALAYALSYLVKAKKVIELAELMEGDEYTDDPFVRRLRKSEAGRKALADRVEELA